VPVIALPIAALLTVLLGRGDPRGAATTLAFGYLMLLTYEWTHFLIHSKYRPRRWYYRVIWRNHRNHHFRNENYWFGVTMDLADRVLRTAPERDAVPVSPTARNLDGRD
jgi:sterol desaturase/sphingolipid hydroxylase (fatty acid hydroxylase superfamily)